MTPAFTFILYDCGKETKINLYKNISRHLDLVSGNRLTTSLRENSYANVMYGLGKCELIF